MNEVLKVILSLSVSGSLLILILVLGKPLFTMRFSKMWQYYIWLVVLVRLLIPFAPETNLIGYIFQEAAQSNLQSKTVLFSRQSMETDLQSPDQTIDTNKTNVGKDITTYPATKIRNIFKIICEYLWLIWLVVALLLLIRKITIYQSFVRYVKVGCEEISDITLLDKLAQIEKQAGVKKAVDVYTNHLVSSPLLLGFFHPCIILPSADLSEIEFYYTSLHELSHYKLLDMFYKWLVQLTLCIHWFNPLIYRMSHELNRLCELSCDEYIIKKLKETERHAYGDTLLNAAVTGGSYKNSLASVTLYESKELLKERLVAIMKYKRRTKIMVIVTAIFTFTLCFGATAFGAYRVSPLKQTENSIHFKQASSQISTFDPDQKVAGLKIKATIGDLSIQYGDKLKIELGAKLVKHGMYSFENGILIYGDDLSKQNKDFTTWNKGDYAIIITIPQNTNLKKVSADIGMGNIYIYNINVQNTKISGTGEIKLKGLNAETLDIHGELADLKAENISTAKALNLYLHGSCAVIAGDIKGDVLIDSSDISNTDITFNSLNQKDYSINASWKPNAGDDVKDIALETGCININGKEIKYDYSDTKTNALYKLAIISREISPAENINIKFRQ
jgi:Antirepressor regulating drug resistance, predicted signal transduction N-terminal membrane component